MLGSHLSWVTLLCLPSVIALLQHNSFTSSDHTSSPNPGSWMPILGWCLQTNEKFFCFFLFSLYVGFVPASDHLGIFSTDWRCNFLSQFLSKNSTIEKNEIPSKIFGHPILDEIHFTFRPTFFVGRELFSLLFLVCKLISQYEINTQS